MPFIPPLLATRLEGPRRLADPRCSAELKLDGQRDQFHINDHHTVRDFRKVWLTACVKAGLAERAAMKGTGHRTRAVSNRY